MRIITYFLTSLILVSMISCVFEETNNNSSVDLKGTRWKTSCIRIENKYLITSYVFGPDSSYSQETKAYNDSSCVGPLVNANSSNLNGTYQIGQNITLADGTKVTELDLTVKILIPITTLNIYRIDGDKLYLGFGGVETRANKLESIPIMRE